MDSRNRRQRPGAPCVRIRASQAAETIVPDVDGTALGQDTVETFKAFADDVDAWLLDDQIEAAAAYSTHILGQEEFSRPDLMKLVLAYNEGKEVSREDMLRGFGTLLREGRLERGNAGAFRLAPASEYDEPARKYAQRLNANNTQKAPAARAGAFFVLMSVYCSGGASGSGLPTPRNTFFNGKVQTMPKTT